MADNRPLNICPKNDIETNGINTFKIFIIMFLKYFFFLTLNAIINKTINKNRMLMMIIFITIKYTIFFPCKNSIK